MLLMSARDLELNEWGYELDEFEIGARNLEEHKYRERDQDDGDHDGAAGTAAAARLRV